MGGGLCPLARDARDSHLYPHPRALPAPDGQRPAQYLCLWDGVPKGQYNLGAWKSLRRHGLLKRGPSALVRGCGGKRRHDR